MVSYAKPGLAEDLYIVQKEEYSVTGYMCDTYIWQRPNIFIRDEPIFLVREDITQGLWRQGFSWKKILDVRLKGLDVKIKSLAVYRQS
jgi:hypothetical protein